VFATVMLQQFTTHPCKKFVNIFYLILQISKILFPNFLIKSSKYSQKTKKKESTGKGCSAARGLGSWVAGCSYCCRGSH
jgi:hypothetical protein